MKNIFKIFSSENLKKNIKTTWDRFPVSVIMVLIVSGLMFTILHFSDSFTDDISKEIGITIFSIVVSFVFSIGIYLSTENTEKNKLQRNLFQIIPIIFGVIFYNIFSLEPNNFESILFFLLSFTGIIAFLFFAPYINKIPPFKGGLGGALSQSVFYTYFYNISAVILISFIFAGVLFGLGAIGITAVDTLFDLNIDEAKTYGNWSILSLAIIAPLFALTQIPNKKSFSNNHFNENAFFSFMIKFVAIPFIYLYFFILYAYTIKVLANFGDWPKGEVTWLVIGFSIFGYLAYSFSYIFEEKNKLIKSFRKIFPYAVIPQVFMLFYAIYLRLNQYDLTINRYFVVVFGLWLLVISLYFIFSKKKNLIAIPAILALFIIIISVVPKFNIYSFPEERQLERLKSNLLKANIGQNVVTVVGKKNFISHIVPLKKYSDISKDLSRDIYSGIKYLCDFKNCKKIKELFPEIYSEILEKDKKQWEENLKVQIEDIEKYKNKKQCEYTKYGYTISSDCFDKERLEKLKKEKYDGPQRWEIIGGITDKIKVKKYFGNTLEEQKYFEFTKKYKQDIFPINTKGFSKIYSIRNYYKWNEKSNYAEFNTVNQEIIIKENGEKISKIDISEINKKLLENFGKNDKRDLDKKDLIFILEDGKYKLIFENIFVKNPNFKETDDKNIKINFGGYSHGYILVK